MSTAATLPRIHFPPELPVSRMREEIAHAIRDNQVVIVAGATGSGKTTQLPKIALELGRTSIGHTQPRRIAARTIAERIAEELGQPVGELVGYQVRFTDKVSRATRIKLMTDGILLNELRRDRLLRAYDTIIIDEAHERSLNIDFLLGYLKQLLPQRPDLKLIITSATIDPESFARHFAAADGSPAPIVEVSGRTYPVEIRYRPLVAEALEDGTDDADDPDPIPSADRDYLQGINDALDELAREASGDVLVFLSGENEIRDAADAIRGRNLPGTEVLPLYGRLSAAEQHRVFQASTTRGIRRRVVLATNVAETSLTVPGIKYVVDAGTARISRYSTRAKVQRLPIEAISQASANQRSGRSGRTSDGIAIRLYSEEDFERRPEFTEPEILRTNLAAVILQMISLGLGDIAAFPFLTPPDSRGIKDGLDLLTELGAISSAKNGTSDGAKSAPANGADTRLTPVGRQLAQLPIDPRFARMVVESKRHSTSREVMAIVAGLTIQDPRERPVEKRGSADEKHARFADPSSDFLTLLNLWNYLEEQQKELSSSAFRRLCKAEYLNFLRVREWQDVYRQLRQLAKPLGLTISEPSVNPDGIHRSLLAGLLSHIGLKDLRESPTGSKSSAHGSARGPRSSEYLGARQTRFVIFPGSTLAKKQPNAVMSAELVETSRLFARMNAAIDPAWAVPIAGDLCKRQYSEPHWEKGQGSVVAYERVTLFGVPIIPRRRVQYARIDAELSRELFIRHALVDGEWDSHQAFDRANRRLRAELRELEERTRRRDILNDDEAVFEFYDKRIPADIASTRSFEGWWKKARQETPDLLTMTPEALLDEEAAEVDEDAFPPVWRQGDQQLTLRYRFEPGAEDDGVTVQVPLPLLAGLLPDGFDWQVPGLRHELVTALIKSLPKAIRRQVVPAADWARRLLGELAGTAGMRAHEGERPAASLTETLAATISRLTGSRVSASDFDLERLPAHLRPTFEVIGERGRTLAGGKDLGALQDRLRSRARDSVAAVAEARTPNALERAGLTTWDFDELPRFLDTTHTGPGGTQNVIRAYPALVDDGGSVSIRLMGTPAEQARAIPGGVRRLLLASIPSPVAYVQQHLTSNEKLTLAGSPYPNTKALFDDCLLAVVDSVLYRMKPDGQVFMRAEFEAVRDRVSGIVMDAMFETVALVTRILTAARAAEKAIAGVTALTYLSALNDAKGQLGGLVWAGRPAAGSGSGSGSASGSASASASGSGSGSGSGSAGPGFGFVSATGLEQLRHLPRYLAGISQRMQALPTNPGRDRAWQTQVETAVALYTDAGGRIPLAPDSPLSLVHARWMLEEFRVSLFAQSLGTAESVSLQRIRKVLTP